ncbi:MAG: GDSL-type esterase/lipase family protein [Hyphomicrobiaceae bacterium]
MAAAMSVALLVALANAQDAAAQSPPPPATKASEDANGHPLASFHAGLAALERRRTSRLTILQLGDSHTAGDMLSGRLRERLQRRFGNAGRGMLPPGEPFIYWRPHGHVVVQAGDWTVLSSHGAKPPPAAYGLSGFVLRGTTPVEEILVASRDDKGTFDSVEVGYLTRPDGGRLDVLINGRRLRSLQTRAAGRTHVRRAIALPRAGRELALVPHGDGPVDITDWSLLRASPGIVVTSLGIPGAQIGVMSRWHWPSVERDIRHLAPRLLILAFGTNEGFGSLAGLAGYARMFEQRLARLRRAAPDMSVVVLGPPDANRLPSYCDAARAQADARRCQPLTPEEMRDYDALIAARNPRLCHWHTPPGLALVRRAQRQAAQRQGALFIDWAELQGGLCGADAWARRGLAAKDRVHLTREGYHRTAEHLLARILDGYPGR